MITTIESNVYFTFGTRDMNQNRSKSISIVLFGKDQKKFMMKTDNEYYSLMLGSSSSCLPRYGTNLSIVPHCCVSYGFCVKNVWAVRTITLANKHVRYEILKPLKLLKS